MVHVNVHSNSYSPSTGFSVSPSMLLLPRQSCRGNQHRCLIGRRKHSGTANPDDRQRRRRRRRKWRRSVRPDGIFFAVNVAATSCMSPRSQSSSPGRSPGDRGGYCIGAATALGSTGQNADDSAARLSVSIISTAAAACPAI